MIKRWYILIPAALLLTTNVKAQEVVTGKFCNTSLSVPFTGYSLKSTKSADTLELPFYDDFSSGRVYPDQRLWKDSYVFINNTFSVKQPTKGVATFDALDEHGELYGNASYRIFTADTLTSLPINLGYSAADSIYLSFLYEAGGIADTPEENDSLTLEFYAPADKKWQSVWRTGGSSATGFNQVMIRITSEKFLKKGFRFRFTNYASLSSVTTEPSKAGNADQWNLDCVILNKNRTVTDTIMRDVAFTTPLRSLLNDLEAMPWRQYKKSFLVAMSQTATLAIRNNDNDPLGRNVTPVFSITDKYKNKVVKEITPEAVMFYPLTDNYLTKDLGYKFDPASHNDSALFLVKSYFKDNNPYDHFENDTISFLQVFGNYFAYDDGTAEAGYGINGEGSDNAMVALRYRSYMADSVSAISICFNDAYNNSNQRYFSIVVWSDNDGKPGTIIATQDNMLAKPAKENNGFITYYFDKPVYVDNYFWVGWKQGSETFLNAGLDMNTPHQNRQYYWLNGNWYSSSVNGTVLMRAVMTGDATGTSSEDNTPEQEGEFRLYPNPASESITVSCPGNDDQAYNLTIYNIAGSPVIISETCSDVSIRHLSAGNYIVVVRSAGNRSRAVFKLIKSQ